MSANISKNARVNRGQVAQYYYNGKVVIPMQYFGSHGSYICAAYKDTKEIIFDANENPIRWDVLNKSTVA